MGFFNQCLAFEGERNKNAFKFQQGVNGETDFGADVWYRKFLKPLSRKSLSDQEAYHRRMLRPRGIPLSQLYGLHEIFTVSFQQYSPLYAMIYSYNNMVDNLYRFGNESNEPAVELIKCLFHMLPGGEIQPTHLGGQAGAHLSPSSIGEIFEAFESLKNAIAGPEVLQEKLLNLITVHADYREGVSELRENVKRAQHELEKLQAKDDASIEHRARIKYLEGDIIKPALRQFKRLEKQLAKKKVQNVPHAQQEMKELQDTMDEAQNEVDDLRSHIVTSLDFKMARKAVKRATDLMEAADQSRFELTQSLANSFVKYDTTSSSGQALPSYTTTFILMAFMWRKYDNITALQGYIEAMSRLGALSVSLDDVEKLLTAPRKGAFSPDFSKHVKSWSSADVAGAAITMLSKPGAVSRPPVVEFSYIRWAEYSSFPDCGETALRNLLNQLLYDPKSNRFSIDALDELRQQHYPNLSQRLMDFYQKHSHPREVADYSVARDFLLVVSGLNTERDYGVRYRRECGQANIASPLANLLRAFNALFGVDPNQMDTVSEVAEHLNKILGTQLQIDLSGVKTDGFGTMGLTDGKVMYELQSYKPVHFGFVQVATTQSEKDGRQLYAVFRSLLRYSTANKPENKIEQTALASLFAPFHLQGHKMEACFRAMSVEQWAPLFADLETVAQRQAFTQWARDNHPVELNEWIDHIDNYKEPVFMPQKKQASEE